MINVNPNKICFIFDVDGTLTLPRKKMDSTLIKEFVLWAKSKQCFIATGSDYNKIKYQLPTEVLNSFENVFCCMGNEVRDKSENIVHKSNFTIPDELDRDLAAILESSKYPIRTGNHIEFRTGMINFSIVGRNADFFERDKYNKWDAKNKERQKIVKFINDNYPVLNASIGGSISIDIIEEGCDKGQVVHHLENSGATKIVFVGDRTFPGGNDWGIVRELKKTNLAFEWYQVSDPKETLSLLRTNKVFDGGK